MAQQKLELTWIGKDQRPRLEPRILLEDPARSYHASMRVTEKDIFDNRLIKGDNLLALKALEAEFAGKVKCVFIDPPYNTGSAFTHYDDGLEHSIWLGLMRDRLEIIRRLLADEGSLWITIDDNEAHYLKVLCDEIFGRSNFVATFAWEKDKGRRNDTDISSAHDHVLLYARNRDIWRKIRNPLPRTDEQKARYRNLQISTNPGDLVLDSFAGSGTTGAVAHKMGRRWIMVELGEHCHTHIVPRLRKVIDGQDPGGVTQATGWQGGGASATTNSRPRC
jgi:adenine-specific DNA-methyltransferase